MDYNCVKGLRVNKFVNLSLKGSGVREKTIWTKYLRQNLHFISSSTLREKLNFYFPVLTKVSFLEENWALRYNFVKFWDYPDVFLFSKNLTLMSFGSLWSNSYMIYLLIVTTLFHLQQKKELVNYQRISK